MSTHDKKFDDEPDTPAAWIAKHAPGRRILRRADSSNASTASSVKQPAYQSARTYRPARSEKDSREHDIDCEHFCDCSHEAGCPTMTANLSKSKPFRRIFILLFGVLALGYFCWRQAVGPLIGAEFHIKEGFMKSLRGTYGMGDGGDFISEQNRVVTLDSAFMPGGSLDPDGKRRLIFVGDIHGCKHELHQLLKACAFDEQLDHLVTTGDVISKGPDSPGVIDELIRLNATTVRGNHEDRILTLAAADADEAKNQAKAITAASSKDSKLLRSLHKRHLAYLHDTPLILRIPTLHLTKSLSKAQKMEAMSSEILVVHAGLVPAVPLAKQDPYYVMNMRSIGRRGHVPSSRPASKSAQTLPWFELWNWYQQRLTHGGMIRGWHKPSLLLDNDQLPQTWYGKLMCIFISPKQRPQIVVYGHDSKVGLMDHHWTKGLDSSCVRGGRLTALVLDAYGKSKLVHVKCKDYKS